MGKDDLNDKIRDRLIDHEEFIDKDELWNSLGIEEDKKRKPFIWWFTGSAILLILMLIIGFGLLNNNDQGSTMNNTLVGDDLNNSKNETTYLTNQPTQDATVNIDNALKNIDTEETNGIEESTINQPLNLNQNSTTKIAKNTIILEKPTTNSLKVTEIDQPYITSSENSIENELEVLTVEEQSEDIRFNQQNDIQSKTVEEEAVNLTQISAVNSLTLEVATPNQTSINNPLEQKAFIRPIQQLNSPFSWYAFAGVGKYNRSFKLQNENIADLYNERNSKEKPLENISFGLGLKYNISPSIYAKMGLDYMRHIESYSYSSSEVIEVYDTLYQNANIDFKGDTSYFNPGIVLGFQTNTDRFKYYNMLHTVNVPILLGFQKTWSKWGFFVEGGPIINAALFHQGHSLNTRGRLEKDPKDIYKSNIGIGLEGSLGMHYQLSSRNKLWLSPTLRYMTSSITNDNYGISHKISSWNVRMGMERRF